jgi:hypothetical protein
MVILREGIFKRDLFTYDGKKEGGGGLTVNQSLEMFCQPPWYNSI